MASFIPQDFSNQRKRVLPAVCAKGRSSTGSLGPGACPISITSLTIAPPETGVDCMRGHRRHFSNCPTCSFSAFCRSDLTVCKSKKRCEDASHSKSPSREILDDVFCFATAFRVRTRPRVALGSLPISAGRSTITNSAGC